MTKPYLVVSDLHAHSWTSFARANADGVNSRLHLMLRELKRATGMLLDRGGNLMVVAGDILHTRGSIDPEVLNPLRDTFDEILANGVDVVAIPGNHDLKSAETSELASAIQNLVQLHPMGGSFRAYNQTAHVSAGGHDLLMVPWQNSKEALLAQLQDVSDNWGLDKSRTDVFIHAGIDGVLSGMPAHGLTHMTLGAFGFRRVFAGHYHNHKDFGNGVVSIGALTHQNWGDIGTRAGFILVEDGSFEFVGSKAPRFIDISGLDEDELLMEVPGNYCRFRGSAMTQDEVNELRKALTDMGAEGVSIEVPRVSTVTRSTSPAKGLTLEQSIEGYLATNPPAHAKPEDVLKRAVETLHQSQAVVS